MRCGGERRGWTARASWGRAALVCGGDSAPSVLARRQLELVRERFGGEDWELEVVDVFESPEVAEADGIIATPVLVRLYPAPRLSVIGDLGISGGREDSGLRGAVS